MCVIICCEKSNGFPSREILEQAVEMNPDGLGVGWTDDGFTKWRKNLTVDQLMNMIKKKKITLPCVIHARICTSGGIENKKQHCHPFPLSDLVSTSSYGKSKSGLLFHNGTWDAIESNNWFVKAMDICAIKNIKIPEYDQLWSDSRILALCFNLYGLQNFISMSKIDPSENKIAILLPSGIIKKFGKFIEVKSNNNSVMCSNDHFTYSRFYTKFGSNGYLDNDDLLWDLNHRNSKNALENKSLKQNIINFQIKYGLPIKKFKKSLVKKLSNQDFITYSQLRFYCRKNKIKNQLTLNDDQINDLVLKYNHTDKTDKTPIKIALQQDHDIERYDYPDFDYNGYLDEYERFKTRDGKVYYE